MRFDVRLALLLASAAVATPVAAADAKLAADAKAFGTRESTISMDLSPSGRKLLEIVSGPGRSSIVRILDLQSGSTTAILKSVADPEVIRWCQFATDETLVCKYGAYADVRGQLVGFSRLVSVSTDGETIKDLGERRRMNDAGLRQFAGEILDWLPNDPGSVLMARTYVPQTDRTSTMLSDQRSGLGVDRINLATSKIERVEPPLDHVSSYMTDGRGTVRLAEFQREANGYLTGRYDYRYRPAGSRVWSDFVSFDSVGGTGILPLAVDPATNAAYALQKSNGRYALYRIAMDSSRAATPIAANPTVDIDGLAHLGADRRVVGYTFTDDRKRIVYFDPELAKVSASLKKALPTQPIVEFDGSDLAGNKLLIRARGDNDPGAYYLFDKTTKQLSEVGKINANIEGRALASVKQIVVPGAGGVSIPAYLTLPPGSEGKNLPAVVLPHGGPTARDEWGFDWLSQFLAARGYAVIQPNFRGSSGYGDGWLGNNAFRDWKAAMSDVAASARYLSANGIADPKRIAIVGWSYGGYAALQSAAIDPDLYRGVVAIAPVTDLDLLKREHEGFTSSRLVRDFVGSGENIVAGSPARQAAKINAPVLMFHGSRDANVGVDHSQKMRDALSAQGKKVELVTFRDLEHQLDDSDARVQMLTRIGEFLDSTIGQ